MARHVLTEELRQALKEPYGELLTGPEQKIVARINAIMSSQRPKRVVSVGDNVSRLLNRHKVRTNLRVIDNREMREPAEPYSHAAKNIFKVANPAGVIEDAVWPTVTDALKKSDSLLIVDGEEDLLTLVAVALSPLGSLIVYGQPGRGVVALTVDKVAKGKVDAMLRLMYTSSD